MESDGSTEITEDKRCEQSEQWKPLCAFHRRKNKTDGRMFRVRELNTAKNALSGQVSLSVC